MTRLALLVLVGCGGSGSTAPDAVVPTCLPAQGCAASGQVTGTIAGHAFGAITNASYTCGSGPAHEGPAPTLSFGDGALSAIFGVPPHGAMAWYQDQDLGVEWVATDSFINTSHDATGCKTVTFSLDVQLIEQPTTASKITGEVVVASP
jgi:hypothetical protein